MTFSTDWVVFVTPPAPLLCQPSGAYPFVSELHLIKIILLLDFRNERKEELQAKLPSEEDDQQVKTARTFADFQTELAHLAEVWDDKSEKEKREFVSLLVEKIVKRAGG